MMGRHRSTTNTLTRRERLSWAAAVVFVSILLGGVAVAAPGDTVGCAPGQELIVKAAGTWECRTAPAPSGSPSASPSTSPSASPSPSTSPSPSPSPSTTPAPTTPPPTTPPPSPSPTGQLTNCVSLPSRCGFPDATNTGAKGTLTAVNGDVTLRTAGQVYADREVSGCITVAAANVTIRNVKVHCSGYWGIEYYGPTTGTLTIQDTTVDCGTNRRGTGIDDSTPSNSSARLVIQRVNSGQGCENAFAIYHDTLVEDSYCHGLTPEAGPGGDPNAHTDCIQGDMLHDITIRHNTLLAPFYATSAIEGDCGSCGSWVRVRWSITNNLMDGGGYRVYCTARSAESGSVVSGNRFGDGGWNAAGLNSYATSCDAGVSWTNNVRDSSGAALAAR